VYTTLSNFESYIITLFVRIKIEVKVGIKIKLSTSSVALHRIINKIENINQGICSILFLLCVVYIFIFSGNYYN
jgi:hypothetical protein